MKSRLISNNTNLLTMFKLGGIEGVEVINEKEARIAFLNATKDENLAVLIVTKTIEEMITNEINDHRLSSATPLLVVIDG